MSATAAPGGSARRHASPAGPATVYLLDRRTATERDVLHGWIGQRGVDGQVVDLADHGRLDQILADAEAAGLDPLLQPLGVTWLAPLRDGERRFRLRDTLTPGDPRHPPAWLQPRLQRADPHRAEVVVAEPARLSEVRQRWIETDRAAGPHPPGDDRSSAGDRPGSARPGRFRSFLSRQARVALQREVTRRHGAAHKVPIEVRAEVTEQGRFDAGVARLAAASGRTVAEVRAEATAYLDEMVATLNRHAVDITAEVARLYHRTGMRGRVHTDPAQIAMVTEAAATHPTVFLSNHRSYLDATVLAIVLRDHGLPPNHRLGGANMAVGPFGAIGRRNGIIYIRRSFRDNEVYKWVLREYLGYLASKRFSLEWNIEGTRSRTGKLGPPKLGLLAYVVDAYLEGRCADYQLIPVAITYDELIDVEEFARYARGSTKRSESVRSFVGYVRRNREFYGLGDMHVRFAPPVSLRAQLGPPHAVDPDRHRDQLRALAHEVAVRINDVSPITPTALVALVLLAERRAVTLGELRLALDALVAEIDDAGLPLTDPDGLATNAAVESALEPLLRHDGLTRVTGGHHEVYAITDDQRLVASYYRNTVLHHFVDTAIAQVALQQLIDGDALAGGGPGPADDDPVDAVHARAAAIRRLLRAEFFFPDDAACRRRLDATLTRRARTWRARLRRGPRAEAAATLLDGWTPLLAPVVLRSIVDAYWVVAATLRRGAVGASAGRDETVTACLGHGRQLLLQGRIGGSDSVSALLFENALTVIDAPDRQFHELDALRGALDGLEARQHTRIEGGSR